MKITTLKHPRAQQGSAVVVTLAFVGIMVVLVAANTKTVNWLAAEVRLTNQRETARLAASAAHLTMRPVTDIATNTP